MKASFKVKALVSMLALAGAGSAFAQVNASGTTGELILNVYDSTKNAFYTFDTGLNAANFNGATGNYSFSLSSDANFTSFLSAAGSDALVYDVVGAKKTGAVGETFFATATSAPASAAANSKLNNALGNLGGFEGGVALEASSVQGSVFVATPNFGDDLSTEQWSQNLGIQDFGAVGTALSFYTDVLTTGSLTSNSTKTTLTALAGTWNFVNGTLTYTTATQAVPVPASWGLLLSGLVLMGVVSRRKAGAGDVFPGAAI